MVTMLKLAVYLFVVLAQIRGSFSTCSNWSYCGEFGVNHWPYKYEGCSGERQSPIDIDTTRVVPYDLGKFEFENYDALPLNFEFSNNGHTVNVVPSLSGSDEIKISGGNLPDDYILAQFHFHWGSFDKVGSEHTIDGKSCPLEVHFVHYKASYGNLSTAVGYSDGLAVLGVLVEVCSSDNPNYHPIISSLSSVKYSGSVANSSATIELEKLFPQDLWSFYRYDGGLTTPCCNEVVIWTVFQQKVYISEVQLQIFRTLMDDHFEALQDNYRTPQDLAGRVVLVNSLGHGSHFSLGLSEEECEAAGGTYIEETGDCFEMVGTAGNYDDATPMCCSKEGKPWKYFEKMARSVIDDGMSVQNICNDTSECSPYEDICEFLGNYTDMTIWVGEGDDCYQMTLDSDGHPVNFTAGCTATPDAKVICDLNMYTKDYCEKKGGRFFGRTCECFLPIGYLLPDKACSICAALKGKLLDATTQNVQFLKSRGLKEKNAWDRKTCTIDDKDAECYRANFRKNPSVKKDKKRCAKKRALAICQI